MTMTALPGRSSRLANCTLIARKAGTLVNQQGPGSRTFILTWAFALERVTGIEPALSAWEACGAARQRPGNSATCGDLGGLTVGDRDCPQELLLSGT
jgi:hypothetical protein